MAITCEFAILNHFKKITSYVDWYWRVFTVKHMMHRFVLKELRLWTVNSTLSYQWQANFCVAKSFLYRKKNVVALRCYIRVSLPAWQETTVTSLGSVVWLFCWLPPNIFSLLLSSARRFFSNFLFSLTFLWEAWNR